jgi:hypothetical protein
MQLEVVLFKHGGCCLSSSIKSLLLGTWGRLASGVLTVYTFGWQLCDLYENDSIFDKFECCLSGDGQRVATGSYRYCLFLITIHTEEAELCWRICLVDISCGLSCSCSHLSMIHIPFLAEKSGYLYWTHMQVQCESNIHLWLNKKVVMFTVSIWKGYFYWKKWELKLRPLISCAAICFEYLELLLVVRRHPPWKPVKVQTGTVFHQLDV